MSDDLAVIDHDVPSKPRIPPEVMEKVIIGGDLSDLKPPERSEYYMAVCRSLGLNPFTKPFEYMTLNGKLRLYALRDCADQLRRLHGISIYIVNRERLSDIYIVTARAKDRSGREDESTGAVTIGNLKGDALANAYMKCETKAKRRVTLSIAGLGWADAMELETFPEGQVILDESLSVTVPSPSHEDREHPTAEQIIDLLALVQQCGVDLTTFGQRIREFMQWPSDVKITKKYLREELMMPQYEQILQDFTARRAAQQGRAEEQPLDDPDDDVPEFAPPVPQDDSTPAEAVGVLDDVSSSSTEDVKREESPTNVTPDTAATATDDGAYATPAERQRVQAYAEQHGLGAEIVEFFRHYPKGVTITRLIAFDAALHKRVEGHAPVEA